MDAQKPSYSFTFTGYETHEYPETDSPKVLRPPYMKELKSWQIVSSADKYDEPADTAPQSQKTGSQKSVAQEFQEKIEKIAGQTDITAEAKIAELKELKAELQNMHDRNDSSCKIPQISNIEQWIQEINPHYDPFDWQSPYSSNCGSCAFAVEQRLNGNTDISATSQNIGTIEEMNKKTGMEQVAMSPGEIKDYLIAQGPGSHGIVGIDRASGPGHWFNAYYDGKKVVAIDGQTGEIYDWPPDYGDVIRWDISVRKEKAKDG